MYGSHLALSKPRVKPILDQQRICPDPTVPPPQPVGQGRSASGNHCFAQIIKKSGHLCLTLDIRAVCACGAASLVFAEDHVYGGPVGSHFSDGCPPPIPHPPNPANGTHRAPYTLIRSFDSCAGSFMFSRSAINYAYTLSDPLPVVVPAAYGGMGAVLFAAVSVKWIQTQLFWHPHLCQWRQVRR